MEIENLIRYPALAVGLKPSAIQGKARLRGTRTPTATLSPIAYRLSPIGYQLSPIGYEKPSAMEREARRLHGRERSNCSTTMTAADKNPDMRNHHLRWLIVCVVTT